MERAKTLIELAQSSLFLFKNRPLSLTDKAEKILNPDARKVLANLTNAIKTLDNWTEDALSDLVFKFAESEDLKLGKVAQPIRAALTGTNVSPSVFEIMEILGRQESLARLDDQIK